MFHNCLVPIDSRMRIVLICVGTKFLDICSQQVSIVRACIDSDVALPPRHQIDENHALRYEKNKRPEIDE